MSQQEVDPQPEMGIDDHGDVFLEWWYGHDDLVSLRISPLGVVSWAGCFQGDRSHGEFMLPLEIAMFLHRHYTSEVSDDI